MRNATRAQYERATDAVEFPASKEAIVAAARDKGGLDAEVGYILGHLPAESYDTRDDLDRAIEATYAERGGLEGDGPAAPAEGQRPDPRVAEATDGA